MAMGTTYLAYGDRSGSGSDQFWSFSLLTIEESRAQEVAECIRENVTAEGVSKVEWKLIDGSREAEPYKRAALALVTSLLNSLDKKMEIRVDTILWDHHDERHSVRGRDDDENTGRMAYKVFIHASTQRRQYTWKLYLDRGENFNRNKLVEVINNTYSQPPSCSNYLWHDIPRNRYLVSEHNELDSADEPLLWIPDMFAGMHRWSAEKPFISERLPEILGGQEVLFTDERNELSRSDKQRMDILARLLSECKKLSIPLDTREKHCLWTRNPNQPINFWPYEPQGDYDKAPQRSQGSQEPEMEPYSELDWDDFE